MKNQNKVSYAEKVRRKFGGGTRDPKWQWWSETAATKDNPSPAPRPVARDSKPGPVSRHNHSTSLRAALLGGA